MKTYKEIISEVAEPKGEDEKRFKAKHIIQKINHPAAEEGQFTGGKTAKKDKSKLSGHKDAIKIFEAIDKHSGNLSKILIRDAKIKNILS